MANTDDSLKAAKISTGQASATVQRNDATASTPGSSDKTQKPAKLKSSLTKSDSHSSEPCSRHNGGSRISKTSRRTTRSETSHSHTHRQRPQFIGRSTEAADLTERLKLEPYDGPPETSQQEKEAADREKAEIRADREKRTRKREETMARLEEERAQKIREEERARSKSGIAKDEDASRT